MSLNAGNVWKVVHFTGPRELAWHKLSFRLAPNAFTSSLARRDPIGYWDDSWNLFQYVKNMAVTLVDPSGLWQKDATPTWQPGSSAHITSLVGCNNWKNTEVAACYQENTDIYAINACLLNVELEHAKCRKRFGFVPTKYCGLLKVDCECGSSYVSVTGGGFLPGIILGSGCMTFPGSIVCTGTCAEIKRMMSADNPKQSILDHEGCHYCAFKCKGCFAYLGTAGAAPDGCVGNEVPTYPTW